MKTWPAIAGRLTIFVGMFFFAAIAHADSIRIATWNITNYAGGQTSDLHTAIYGNFSGRCLCPDVLAVQEIISQSAVNDLVSILNSASGSPGDWAAATFFDGADTDSAFFYRTGEIQLVTDLSATGVTVVSVGSPATHPRNIMRYDFRPVGYTSAESTIALYSTHMKAGSTGTDEARRLVEAEIIRNDAEVLPVGWNFILAGDFNIQSSNEDAYQELVGSQVDNTGRFFDPINTPGNWNNNSSYRFVHTQEPSTQMDDRYDIILISDSFQDGIDFEYDGNTALAYNGSTWNDPNHSYRAWGNDGTSYNSVLTTTGNTMVGPTIAQALINLASNNGHVPVFADFTLPPNDLGACCTPCGCDDLLNEADCIAAGGSFRGIGVDCGSEVPPCTVSNSMRINEVRVRPDSDPQFEEFIELIGDPGQPLCGISLAVIEGEGSSKGRVDRIIGFDDCGSGEPCEIDSNGYFVVGGSGVGADLVIAPGSDIFENGSQTILLLRDSQLSTAPPNNDVDVDENRVEDVDPQVLGLMLDAVGVINSDYYAGFDPDAIYFGAPFVGPAADDAVASGGARCPNASTSNGFADWVQISEDTSASSACMQATPGLENPDLCGGDDDIDGDLDLRDFSAFQRCFSQSSAACAIFDFDGDCTVGASDVDFFRSRLELLGP